MRCGKCWKDRDAAKFKRVVPEDVALICSSCWYEFDTWMGWLASHELRVAQQGTLPGITPGSPPTPPEGVDPETGEIDPETAEDPPSAKKRGRAKT